MKLLITKDFFLNLDIYAYYQRVIPHQDSYYICPFKRLLLSQIFCVFDDCALPSTELTENVSFSHQGYLIQQMRIPNILPLFRVVFGKTRVSVESVRDGQW